MPANRLAPTGLMFVNLFGLMTLRLIPATKLKIGVRLLAEFKYNRWHMSQYSDITSSVVYFSSGRREAVPSSGSFPRKSPWPTMLSSSNRAAGGLELSCPRAHADLIPVAELPPDAFLGKLLSLIGNCLVWRSKDDVLPRSCAAGLVPNFFGKSSKRPGAMHL